MSKCMKFHLGILLHKHHQERFHETNKKTYPNYSLLPCRAAVLPSVAVPKLGIRSSNFSVAETKLVGGARRDPVCDGYPLASACLLTVMQWCWVSSTCLEFC